MKVDAPRPNVDFYTVVISVEETTEQIIAHHFQGRVPADQDNENGWKDSTMDSFIALICLITLFDESVYTAIILYHQGRSDQYDKYDMSFTTFACQVKNTKLCSVSCKHILMPRIAFFLVTRSTNASEFLAFNWRLY